MHKYTHKKRKIQQRCLKLHLHSFCHDTEVQKTSGTWFAQCCACRDLMFLNGKRSTQPAYINLKSECAAPFLNQVLKLSARTSSVMTWMCGECFLVKIQQHTQQCGPVVLPLLKPSFCAPNIRSQSRTQTAGTIMDAPCLCSVQIEIAILALRLRVHRHIRFGRLNLSTTNLPKLE